MAGRRGVPARGAAGFGRPLLWHPGRQARRPAAAGDRAGESGAGETRSAGPRPDRPRARRRPAIVRRALARRCGSRAAKRGRATGQSGEGTASRRDVAARGAGRAVPPEVSGEEGRAMTFVAWLLVWLAL